MESQPLRTVLLLGRPGSGKGTQTGLLAEHLGWKTVSSGNIFRELRNDQSPLGEKVRETYDTGVLFPGWFPTYFFLDAVLKLEAEQGVICEGFARSVDQAEVFDDALGWLGRKYVVFNLEVSEEEALRRQLSRHEIDARPDSDSPEKIKNRLHEYSERTQPVLKYFEKKGVLAQVNGEQTPEQIASELYGKLQDFTWTKKVG